FGGLAALAGLGLVVWRGAAQRGQPHAASAEAGMVLAAWLVIPSLYFLRHSTPVFPHYFILLFPAPFLLAGLALDALLARWRWVWLAPVVLAAGQVWIVLALFIFLGTQATPGGFGTPLGLLLRAAQAAR